MYRNDQRDTLLNRWIIYAVFIAAAYISVTFAYNQMIAEPLADSWISIHQKVINQTAPKPIQYRILTYYLVEGLHRITHVSLWRMDLIVRFIFTTLSMIYLFKYLRRWFDLSASSIGVLIIAAILPVTYMDYIHQPHDIPNLLFTILALMYIRDKKEAWLILLIPIAMLNRESFVMVLWVWFFYNFNRLPFKTLIPEFILFSCIGIAIYLALPYYFGPRESYVEIFQLKTNLSAEMIPKWLLRLIAFAGPLTLAGFIRFKSKPLFLRRSLPFVAIYMITNFLFGMYNETRLFLPILPVIIPLGLATIFPFDDPDQAQPGSRDMGAENANR
jgi:hypothetical protein